MAEDVVAMAPAAVSSDLEIKQEESASPRPVKRHQSSTPEPSNKRPRLSAEATSHSPSTRRTSPSISPRATDPQPPPPKDVALERSRRDAQDERKRGRRLFGGLLSTLSQSASNTQQKRRLEIEQRQQEKARLQKAEDESRKAERLQKLKEVRKREQVKFDEQSMRIRHSNMLAMAQFLCTKAEPKLYYKPWELLPGDSERITRQIADTEALIEREMGEFRAHHNVEQKAEGILVEATRGSAEETEGEHQTQSSPVPPVAESDSTNPLPSIPASESGLAHVTAEKDPLEENGEVVVEGDEDTVIY